MPAIPLTQVAVQLRPADNVAVAARPLPPGFTIEFDGRELIVQGRVGLGHKLAVRPIAAGEAVYKYGQIIGFASQDIAGRATTSTSTTFAPTPSSAIMPSAAIARRRLRSGAGVRDLAWATTAARSTGSFRYGTRNYIAIISTVNCSASTSKYISERLRASRPARASIPTSTASWPITHKAGCAMQYDGPDHHQLDRTLAGFARHPNVAAYILVGLGCETGQAIHLIEGERLDPAQRLAASRRRC